MLLRDEDDKATVLFHSVIYNSVVTILYRSTRSKMRQGMKNVCTVSCSMYILRIKIKFVKLAQVHMCCHLALGAIISTNYLLKKYNNYHNYN